MDREVFVVKKGGAGEGYPARPSGIEILSCTSFDLTRKDIYIRHVTYSLLFIVYKCRNLQHGNKGENRLSNQITPRKTSTLYMKEHLPRL